jgi:ferredoxin
MGNPIWFVKTIQRFFPLRYFVVGLTRYSRTVRRFFDRVLFRGDHVLYLPKNNVIQVHEAVDPSVSTALPSQVVEYFIEQADYHFILNRCICREADGCLHYPIDLGCIFLGEAVKGIHPDLGSRVSKQDALAHLQRAREAGLVQMIGRNHIDSIWMGVGPPEKLLTICNCCECCCLYKMLPEMHRSVSGRVQKMPGVQVMVSEACVGCGKCAQGVCFVSAIRIQDDRAQISDECRGCGRCVEICPLGAITLSMEGGDFVQKSIAQIEPLVDLKASR